MRDFLKPLLWLSGALAVPLFPLLIFGLSFEEQIEQRMNVEMPAEVRFGLIVGLLAVDLFLPIPSSAVSTYGGGVLGTWPATAASWIGMTLGAVIGFALARLFGRRFAARRAAAGDLGRIESLVDRFGPAALLITRALPILAEACVVFVGSTGLSWRRFLPPVMAANLVVSVCYAAFGEYFRGRDALPYAVVLSGTVPLCVALLARRWLPGQTSPNTAAADQADRVAPDAASDEVDAAPDRPL